VAARRTSGFTLVEIMIVVAIIALLAVVAMPSFLRARQRSHNSKFMNALRVASDAIDLYASENPGRYPPDRTRGVLPPELATYLDATLDWTARTPIGGQWDWDFNVFSIKAAISVVAPDANVEQMTEIDAQFDDGDLATGRFRSTVEGRYSCIIEE
jgi:prepilin-type N-terminal cleavage/methylation domain-containing protein